MTTGSQEPPDHPSPTPRRPAAGPAPGPGPEYPAPPSPSNQRSPAGPAGRDGSPGDRPAPARTSGPADESEQGPRYPVPQPGPARGGRRPVPAPAGAGPSDAWRTGHSLWLLLPLFNVGWVGFLVIGVVARNRVWRQWALGYGIFWLFASLVNGVSSSDGGTALAVLAWLAPLVHGGIINKEFLRQAWTCRTGQPYPGDPGPIRELAEHPAAAAPVVPAAVVPAGVEPLGPTDRLPARLTETVNLARGRRFPSTAARRVLVIADLVHPVLDEQRAGRLTGAQAERLAAIVGEYTPQVVGSFLRLPDSYLDRDDRRARLTAELGQQLDSLLDAATTLQSSVFADEADEFEANGRFLRDKFGRSSLDLGPS